MNRPNVIYMHSHDSGRRVSPYGYDVPTPNLQRLAEQSLIFRDAFCAAPTCSPSRAAMLTGQSAHSSGMLGLNHRGFQLTHPKQHIAETLRSNGYSTALCGVNHVAGNVHAIGYERVIPSKTANARFVGPAAAEHIRSKPTAPFYFDVGFVETHRGQFPPRDERDDPAFVQPPISLPPIPDARVDAAVFNSAARLFDQGVGEVLKALDETGLAENTILICTTDHGISFPRHKCNCSDGGMEVMLMIRGPKELIHRALPPGSAVEALVSQIDIYPTLCEWLDIEKPDWLQGKSLNPILRGDVCEVNEQVFAEVNYHAAYEPQRAVRTHRYKYIRRFGERVLPVLANMDDGLSKSIWLGAGYAKEPLPQEALYDVVLDPSERDNLAGVASHQAVLLDLRKRLDAWMKATDDPLLNGPVPLPNGAVANDPDDLSPKAKVSLKGTSAT